MHVFSSIKNIRYFKKEASFVNQNSNQTPRSASYKIFINERTEEPLQEQSQDMTIRFQNGMVQFTD